MTVLLLITGAVNAQREKALMLSVFGTSSEASVTFDTIVPLVQKQFPDRTVFVPYTSKIIREKLNAEIKNPADKILSPEETLEKIKREGYTDIAVASTLLFAGVENDKLKATVDSFIKDNPGIKTAFIVPILSEDKNIQPVVNTMKKYTIRDGINFVVTHGTHEGHPSEKTYIKVAEAVAKTYPKGIAASVEGVPDLDEAMEKTRKLKDKKVRFTVFMFVAGNHAENDISSDDEDSYFSRVKKMGKTPDLAYVDTIKGKRIVSLGLDKDYQKILLNHYAKYMPK
jgi:sirohydrochlorin cobaltochelatase